MVSLYGTISLNNRIVPNKALVKTAQTVLLATRALDRIGLYTASHLEPLLQIQY